MTVAAARPASAAGSGVNLNLGRCRRHQPQLLPSLACRCLHRAPARAPAPLDRRLPASRRHAAQCPPCARRQGCPSDHAALCPPTCTINGATPAGGPPAPGGAGLRRGLSARQRAAPAPAGSAPGGAGSSATSTLCVPQSVGLACRTAAAGGAADPAGGHLLRSGARTSGRCSFSSTWSLPAPWCCWCEGPGHRRPAPTDRVAEPRGVIRSLRRSFAAKLIVGGCVLALIVVGGVASYLIYSRAQQTRAAAQSNADNRVGRDGRGPQPVHRRAVAERRARDWRISPRCATALASPTPGVGGAGDLRRHHAGGPRRRGAAGHRRQRNGACTTATSPSLGSGFGVSAAPEAVRTALTGGQCARGGQSPVAGGCGIELVGGQVPAYVVALPVVSAADVVGAVAYVAPLSYQLTRFQALFNFPTAFIPASSPDRELRPGLDGSAATDPGLARQPRASPGRATGPSTTPPSSGAPPGPWPGASCRSTARPATSPGTSASRCRSRSSWATSAPTSWCVALISDLPGAAGRVRGDLVRRALRQASHRAPRARSGPHRRAATTRPAIPVRVEDELGRLATNVNRMRDAIAGYVRQIEDGAAAARPRPRAGEWRVARADHHHGGGADAAAGGGAHGGVHRRRSEVGRAGGARRRD